MLRYFLKIRIQTALVVTVCATFLTICILQQCLIFTKETVKSLSAYPIILWWTPFMYETIKLINCEGKFQCILTTNRTYKDHSNMAAYLFYGSNFDQNDLPLPKNRIPWAIFHEESPKNLGFFLHRDGQKLFNVTATFSRNSNFPLPLQFLRDLNEITSMKYYVPVAHKNKQLGEISPILYVQSDCDTPVERDSYVIEIMKYISVDSYGVCLNNKKLPDKYKIENVLEDLYDDAFMRFVAQYKFVLAIENSICQDYITEKLWRPLMAGSIPIYLGSPSIEDWLPNRNSAILVKDYKDIYSLVQHIRLINSQDDLYNKHMQHKISLNEDTRITNTLLKSVLGKGHYGIENNNEFPIPAFECHLCRTVHENSYIKQEKSVYECDEPVSRNSSNENWWTTHWRSGLCQAKTLQYFLETLKLSNFTKEMFDVQSDMYFKNNDC